VYKRRTKTELTTNVFTTEYHQG